MALPHLAFARRLAAAFIRAVEDVVVDEGGGVDQLHHHREVEMARADIAGGAAGEQRQRRAEALATALDGVGHVTLHRRVERSRLPPDPLLDRVKLGVDQFEGELQRVAGVGRGGMGFLHRRQDKGGAEEVKPGGGEFAGTYYEVAGVRTHRKAAGLPAALGIVLPPMRSPLLPCPECDGLSRREFLKTSLGGMAAVSAGGILLPGAAMAAPTPTSKSETLVASLYKTLSEEQRKAVCHPFDHPLRQEVDNNWHINKHSVGKFYSKDQQEMVRQIFVGLHSPEYAERVMEQVEHDNKSDGGFGGGAIALFGEPGSGKFEFVLSGRHGTRRCDGDSVEGAAFGGPIFYGHAPKQFNETPDHPANIYWYQAKRANEVFQMLDGKQRETALLTESRDEEAKDTVKLAGPGAKIAGLPVGSLSADQRAHVRKVMADVLAPFRKEDADEALKLIDASGFEKLHLSFYKNQDIGNDGVWDVWQIEGPSMIWYFRGKPHVHVWVHIKGAA